MAKSNQNTLPLTELIIEIERFKVDISNRIKLGEEILNGDVNINSYSEWTDYNEEYLKQSFNNHDNEYKRSYSNAGYTSFGSISKHNYRTVEYKRDCLNYKLENLRKLLNKADLLRTSQNTQAKLSSNLNKLISKDKVFIVHGHDELAKTETARFVEKLGFHPIILHEQASSGKTIIEKIEHYSNVGFGIILYTPCDLGGKSNETLRLRARQNVVFEHGYLIGKIGRNNVCALVKGDIETPNDISGVVYIAMSGGWEYQLAKELKNSGFNVDMNKI